MNWKSLFIALVTLILAFGYSFNASGQYVNPKNASKKALKFYNKASKQMAERDYSSAIVNFNRVIEVEPKFIKAYLRKAGAYYDLHQLENAEKAFLEAISVAPDYDELVYFSLANIQRELHKYDEASENYNKFLRFNNKESDRKKRAEKYLAQSKFAAKAKKNPLDIKPKPLSESINEVSSEYLPSITADGRLMIFTVREGGQEDFYFSHKDSNGIWSSRFPIYDLNTVYNEGSQTLSADGNTMIFAQKKPNSIGDFDLYITEYDGEKWTEPKFLPGWANSKKWDSQPSLSADGQVLYFASTRKGGHGGSDIYRSFRQEDGSWSKAVNLGPSVNSSGNEESPFIHHDNRTLYFRSDGHLGMGGFDLFKADKSIDVDSFEVIENLGYPLNTSGSEGALFVELDGKTAYFATDRKMRINDSGKLKRNLDIYSFEMPERIRPGKANYFKAKVLDRATKLPVSEGMVNLYDLANGESIIKKSLDFQAEILLALPEGTNYGIEVISEGYAFYSENINLQTIDDSSEAFEMTIYLEPLSIPTEDPAGSEAIVLKNVLFEFGSDKLLESSFKELETLRDLLINNLEIKIQINGHTDNIGDDADNLALSESRAKAVYDYLVAENIDPSRISYQGFGESKPIADNESETGRQKNRRTEFLIIR